MNYILGAKIITATYFDVTNLLSKNKLLRLM